VTTAQHHVTAPIVVRGASRLACDAVEQVTNIVEAMHANIASLPMPLSQRVRTKTRGISSLVYDSIRFVNGAARATLDGTLRLVAPTFGPSLPQPQADAAIGALNGVIGDYLAATGNPLAIRMQLRQNGSPATWETLDVPAAQKDGLKLLVMVHGLCMSDRQWSRNSHGHDHGAALARDLGYVPLYLFYNSGRHISENGREFAEQLETLLCGAPQPVEELAIVAHSMGGLVTRSACYYGAQAGHSWLKSLRKIVFLGTPHHGAPLERGGNWLQTLASISPYTAPLARLGMIRSAGVTDLRYGNLLDEDWIRLGRFEHTEDPRQHIPLPDGVDCFAAAVTLAPKHSRLKESVLGDGLVPLASALGHHVGREKSLHIPQSRQWTGHGMSHFDLLSNPELYAKLREWLAERPATH
jgi:pimeloyl-ACP methyl ester carboxylesterase